MARIAAWRATIAGQMNRPMPPRIISGSGVDQHRGREATEHQGAERVERAVHRHPQRGGTRRHVDGGGSEHGNGRDGRRRQLRGHSAERGRDARADRPVLEHLDPDQESDGRRDAHHDPKGALSRDRFLDARRHRLGQALLCRGGHRARGRLTASGRMGMRLSSGLSMPRATVHGEIPGGMTRACHQNSAANAYSVAATPKSAVPRSSQSGSRWR